MSKQVCRSPECGWYEKDVCTCHATYNGKPVSETCRMRCIENDNYNMKFKSKWDSNRISKKKEIVRCWSDCTWVSGCGFCCHIDMKDAAINCKIRRDGV